MSNLPGLLKRLVGCEDVGEEIRSHVRYLEREIELRGGTIDPEDGSVSWLETASALPPDGRVASLYVAKFCGHLAPFSGRTVAEVQRKVMERTYPRGDKWEKAERHGWSVVGVQELAASSLAVKEVAEPSPSKLTEIDRLALAEIHGVLSDLLGDSDVTHIEDEAELRAEEPVQWAAMRLAKMLWKDDEHGT
jgi:hypothetical protein